MITESFIKQVEQGRTGCNQGFTMGLPKLESIIDGVTQANSTLVFSDSGSGKSSLILYAYVYKPLMEHLDDGNYKCSFFALEMSAEMIMGKLLSMYIFEKYGVEISLKELLSRKRNYVLSDEYYQIVQDSMDWMKKVEEIVTIYDKACNAKTLYHDLMKELETTGKFIETDKRKMYVANNPHLIHVVVIDHISLARPSDGHTLKEEIDLISAYLVTLRNMCKISPVIVMQANRNSQDMERRKQGLNNLRLSDTKDSSNVVQDVEIVLAIFNPFREKLASYNKYDVKTLGDKLRIVSVLKSRYGESNVEIGMNFFGRCGIWAELPLPDEIYDYQKYTDPGYLLKDEQEQVDKSIDKPKFVF